MAGALANHYLAAHEASAVGAEADAVAAQARLALRAAAERAATLGATDQAVSFLRQALAVTTDPADRGDLELRAAASATAAGEYDEAEAFARAAVDDFRTAGDEPAAARARAALGAVLLNATKLDTAVTVLEQALAELSADTPGDVRAPVLANLSRAYMRNSAYDAALDAADRALDLAEPLGLDEVIANALNNRGSVLGYRSRYRESGAIMQAAVDIAAAGGYVDAEMRARSNQASHSFEQSPRHATELQWTNLELARRVGHQGMAMWIGSQAISGSWMCGLDWPAALATADELLAIARSEVDEFRILGAEANIRNARGESTDQHLARMRATAEANGAAELVAEVRALVAERAKFAGDFRTAVREFAAAADAYGGLQGPYLAGAVPPAIMLGDVEELRRILHRQEGLPDASGRLPAAIGANGRAAVLAIEARTDEAIAGFRAAWRGVRRNGSGLLPSRIHPRRRDAHWTDHERDPGRPPRRHASCSSGSAPGRTSPGSRTRWLGRPTTLRAAPRKRPARRSEPAKDGDRRRWIPQRRGPAMSDPRKVLPGTKPADRRVRVERPHARYFRYTAPGVYEAKLAVDEASTPVGRAVRSTRRVLFGRPLSSEEELTERLPKWKALPVFSSDVMSSVAYASEASLFTLLAAGTAYFYLLMPISIAIVSVLFIVTFSYRQTIRAYPNGGGSYIVARANLGVLPGLVAAAALLTDYVLTVSVSVAAGIVAIASAFPPLAPFQVPVMVVSILARHDDQPPRCPGERHDLRGADIHVPRHGPPPGRRRVGPDPPRRSAPRHRRDPAARPARDVRDPPPRPWPSPTAARR